MFGVRFWKIYKAVLEIFGKKLIIQKYSTIGVVGIARKKSISRNRGKNEIFQRQDIS